MKIVLPKEMQGTSSTENRAMLRKVAKAWKIEEPDSFCAANIAMNFMIAVLENNLSTFHSMLAPKVASDIAFFIQFDFPAINSHTN